MEKTQLTAVGSVLAAIVASLCCIGPVVVALIGVGSIGAFAAFESLRPYLIGVTALLLGFAFYLTYRKREVQCEDGTCKMESAGKWNTLSVWLATVIAAVALAFPYFGGSLLATASTVPQQSSTQNTEYATAILKVDGMDCKACAAGLQATLGRIEGVRKANVQYEQGKAIIEYNPAKVQPKTFIEQIDEAGFTAALAESKPTTPSETK
jgi:mercuric ion transport protein